MSGDLGALLTGEMGEAEARFAHDDFAGACGRRVTQRVRRRRTVRAVGAGGGTALTAGALAVGATHVPWGLWGTAAVQPGATDCVTPTPGDFTYSVPGDFTYSVPAELSEPTRVADSTVQWTDARGVDVTLSQDADGTWWVTRGTDAPEPIMPNDDGDLTVVTSDGATVVTISAANAVSGEELASTIRYTVDSSPSAKADDCYTPSPTPSPAATASATASASPSPDPTLAAKPEELDGSPFECGFEFDSAVRGSAGGGVTGYEWVDPDTFNASLLAKWPTASDLPLATGSQPLPMAHIDLEPGDDSNPAIAFGAGAPEDQIGDTSMSEPTMFIGASFVQVRDGVVVGTMKVDLESASRYFSFDYDGEHNVIDLVLVDADNAFLACPGESPDAPGLSTYVVAGSFTGYPASTDPTPTTYSWVAIDAE